MASEPKFYYNAWDGNMWHKKMMREGESVVIIGEDAETGCDTAATPYVTSANTNHEWRIYPNPQTGLDDLVDTAEAIKKEMNKEFREIHELISGLSESLESLSGTVADIYDEMQSGFTEVHEAIDDLQRQLDEEVSARTEGDEILAQLIEEEASARTAADGYLQEQIDELTEALSAETAERIAADEELWEGISAETAERIAADEELWEGLSAETAERIAADEELWEGLSAETAERIAADEALQFEIEELKKRTSEPLDDSIVVEVSGYTTYIGVKLPDDGMIKVDEDGLYLDGNFGTDEEDEE
jgi:septal ring factor EnvC (AmiA/AmiB activator)